MEWDLKLIMVKAFNEGRQTDAITLMANNVKQADIQAWDMFFLDVQIIRKALYENIGFHALIYSEAKLLNAANEFCYKNRMRHDMYINMVDEILISLNKRLSIEYLFSKGFNLTNDVVVGIKNNVISQYLSKIHEGLEINIHIEDDKLWYYLKQGVRLNIDTVAKLSFLIEFLTGKKWDL